ncbi:MAG: glutamyl-tRNA reductase [Methanocorpusculum sp.]|nr:glutamyl-tRNA reductase [Methanocorpusculum sp.]
MSDSLRVKLALASFDHKNHDQSELSKARFEDETAFLKKAKENFEGIILLQTCNRVEILVHGSKNKLAEFLKKENRSGFIFFEDEGALLHLSKLAAGTESLIVGEDQILGQLKNALLISEDAKASDCVVSQSVNAAIRLGVRIRSSTKINKGAVSIGSAAVLLAEKLLGDLDGKNILVVGGGEMGKLVTKSLAEKHLRAIYVTNRTYENAVRLADEIGGRAMHLDQLYSCIGLSDVVISCTSAPHEIIKAERLSEIMEDRFWPLDEAPRKLIIIDIAQPCDVEKSCAEIAGVNLFTIDDLKGISKQNLNSRAAEKKHAEEIIEEYLPEFVKLINKTAAGDVLAELYSWAEDIRKRELEKAVKKLENGADAEKIINDLTCSLTKKLLEDAGSAIRRTAEEKDVSAAREVVDKITRGCN